MERHNGPSTGKGILPSTRVLELSNGWSTAAIGGRLLAEMGADVTKLEPPEGDTIHGVGPRGPSGDALATSLLLLGKRQRRLPDLRHLKDQVVSLAGGSDILLFDSYWARHLAAVGLADEAPWRKSNPGLVVCSITPFGQGNELSGWKGGELVLQAMSGLMSINGEPDSPPLRIGFPLVTSVSALLANAAVLSALYRRRETGEGQFIDFAEFDAGMLMLYNHIGPFLTMGKVPPKTGSRHSGVTPFNVYPTKDGMASVCVAGQNLWMRCLKVIGRSDLAQDERYNTGPKRTARHEEVDGMVATWTRQHTTAEVIEAMDSVGVPAGRVKSIREVFEDAHFLQRGLLQQPRGKDAPRYTSGSIFNIDGIRGGVLATRKAQGESNAAPAQSGSKGTLQGSGKPLEGVRILELGAYTTVPLGSRLMADLGAEVVKLAAPEGLEFQPASARSEGESKPAWDFNYTNKKSLFVDLSDPRGRDLIKKLVPHVDVVIHNHAVETMEKWELTYEHLKDLNPRMVYCSVTGFGMGNAQTYRRAFDTVLQGEAGMMSVNGEADGPALKTAPSTVDIVGGMVAAAAVTAALNRCKATGKGSSVDVAMFDTAAWLATEWWPVVWAGGDARRMGNRHPYYPLHNAFTARDGRTIVIAAETPEDEARARALFGVPGQADAEALDAAARAWVGGLDGQEAVRRCQEQGIAAAPVLSFPEIRDHALVHARQMLLSLPMGKDGRCYTFGSVFKVRRGPSLNPLRGPAKPGEDTDAVLAEFLRFSEQEVAALCSAGVTDPKRKSGAAQQAG